MVWLLNSQDMENCESAESICRSILATYTNNWSIFDIFTVAIYFSRRFLNVCKSRTKTSRLTVCPTWIGILWRWTSMLTNLAGHGECRLVLFHAIRNFLAKAIYHFSRLSHQTMFFLGQLAPYNQLLIQPLYRSWDYREHFGIYS